MGCRGKFFVSIDDWQRQMLSKIGQPSGGAPRAVKILEQPNALRLLDKGHTFQRGAGCAYRQGGQGGDPGSLGVKVCHAEGDYGGVEKRR